MYIKIDYLYRSFLLLTICSFCILVSCHKKHSKTTSTSKKNTQKPPKPDANKGKANTIIKTARSYTGTKYKYGGTSRAGMDCSGLMCISFKEAGIILPRTSNEQSKFGKEVKESEIQEGDLVFFTDKKGNNKITHVGLITQVQAPGNVKFIHASTKVGVIETDLFSNYYKPLILKIVRVL